MSPHKSPGGPEYNLTEKPVIRYLQNLGYRWLPRIPDLVCFANGIPLVVIETKSPVSFTSKMGRAFDQIKQYERDILAHFIVYERDEQTKGITKKICRYQPVPGC